MTLNNHRLLQTNLKENITPETWKMGKVIDQEKVEQIPNVLEDFYLI